VKAKNGNNEETAFGLSAGANTCSNPTNGGAIGPFQKVCYGQKPEPITTLVEPANYGGTLEYIWEMSTTGATDGFSEIAGATNKIYQPDSLFTTTWFRRLVRVSCKADWTGAQYSNVLKIKVTCRQIIQIPQGWSYISAFLQPHQPNMTTIWSDIVGANHLTILNGLQGIYAPAPFNINTIGNWNVLKGYKVKMTAPDELVIIGDSLVNPTVSFTAGAHYIPVLTNQSTAIDEVFNDPENDILYMFDAFTNEVYWPEGGINTLTELVPGKGYLANFINPVTLTYPPLTDFYIDNAQNMPPTPGPWPCIRTSDFHLISISREAFADIANADFVGAFDGQGNCVGYASVEKSNNNLLLTVYGDDALTPEIDGIQEGEPIRFRSFGSNNNAEKELTATFNPAFPNADGLYNVNGLSGITGFKESATGVGEEYLSSGVQVYPNPATDELNIIYPYSGIPVNVSLISADGKIVKTSVLSQSQTKIYIQDLQPGIYILKMKSDKSLIMKRVVVN